jgi:hypothetical protein
MTEHEASRTLVKSPPELWAECSDPASLARHLNGSFGEIRITRLEPETAVAWEGEHASGTVRLEPSGWGTRVILTAAATAVAADTEKEAPAAAVAPEPEIAAVPELPPKPEVAAALELPPEPEVAAEPEPEPAVATAPEPPLAPERAPAPERPPPPAEPTRAGVFSRLRNLLRGGRHETDRPPIVLSRVVRDDEPAPPVLAPPEAAEAPPEVEPDVSHVVEPDHEPVLAPSVGDAGSTSEPDAEPTLEVAAEPTEEAGAEPTQEAAARPIDEPSDPEQPGRPAPPHPEIALAAALDSLGQAHHRPFSRA